MSAPKSEAKTFAELTEFTPVYDALVKEFDYKTALVYGRVKRYCQGNWKECRAAVPTIASELHMDKRTVRKALIELVDASYLSKRKRPGTTDVFAIPKTDPIQKRTYTRYKNVPAPSTKMSHEDTTKDTKQETSGVVSFPEKPTGIPEDIWEYSLTKAKSDPVAYACKLVERGVRLPKRGRSAEGHSSADFEADKAKHGY